MLMYDYVASFCDEFQYPEEAKQTLLTGYHQLSENKEVNRIYTEYIEQYRKGDLKDFNKALETLYSAAELCGVHKYTIALLFLIGLSKQLRKIYEDRGISYQIYYDSMCDLKWKLFECKKMHDVWGSFVAEWEAGFFRLELFALGRLQFEIIKSSKSYEKDGHTIHVGDPVINVHIPSCGPLLHEDCLESYRRAAVFFQDRFQEKPIPFVCNSWLLFPPNKEILSKDSHIVAFMKDYDIISTNFYENGSDLWRVFYKERKKDPKELPRDTSLQRGYADWLMKGNKVGMGYGVFFFDGENCL